MWKKLFEGGDFMDLPQLTLVFFIGVFLAVVIWVLRSSRGGHYERMSQLPLEAGAGDRKAMPAENESGGER